MATSLGRKEEFEKQTTPFLPELRLHCYRMMGSFSDAEDLLQDTLLKAWTGADGFEGKSSYRHWLYTIATNACLNALERRKPRTLPRFDMKPLPPDAMPKPTDTDAPWLEPFPDALLGEPVHGPEAQYTLRESIALAFISAVQQLPPLQRATLLLRDVIGWSAAEVASLLDATEASVNSALQRAREKMNRRRDDVIHTAETAVRSDDELTKRYVAAWTRADIPALVALLKEDAAYSMPPLPMWIQGREAISQFLRMAVFRKAGALFKILPTRANGCPAFGVYAQEEEDGDLLPVGLQVLEWDGDKLGAIEMFLVPSLLGRFGLPRLLEAD